MNSKCPDCNREFQSRTAMGTHRRQAHDVPWQDKSKLEELYVEKSLPVGEIADRWECASPTITRWIQRYDLERKYEDEDWLRKKYIEDGLKAKEIGELCNVSQTPILHRLWELDIKLRHPEDYQSTPWRDYDKLKELYNDAGLSLKEVADYFDCHVSTIIRWVKHYGLKKGDVKRAYFYTSKNGYERWGTSVGESTKQMSVHRLAAVAEYGVEDVKNKLVHHKNGIEWDNRPKNLELKTRSEHMTFHNRYGKYNQSKYGEGENES